MPHGRCLKYQLCCLGDSHEITHRVGMRDGDGSTTRDLLLKDRQYAAIAAEDVAKPYGHVARAVMLQAKDDQLGDPLRSTHDIGRVHRLVRGDHYEVFSLE